jgi:hypothetical protein
LAQASSGFWKHAATLITAQSCWKTHPPKWWRRIFLVQAVDYQWSRRSRILAVVAISVRLIYSIPAWADMLYFADGHPTSGKVMRVTGELIELQPTLNNGWKHRSWKHLIEEPVPQVVRRMELINRQDHLEVEGHKPYIGEVVYMDAFGIEMRTQEGTVRIPRFKMRTLVLGTVPTLNAQNNADAKASQDPSQATQAAISRLASPSTSAARALAKSVPGLISSPPSLRIPMDELSPPEPGVEPVYYQKPIIAPEQ